MYPRSPVGRSLFTMGLLLCTGAVLRAQQQSDAASPNSAAVAAQQDPQRVVISVNDEKLTAADVEKILDSLPPQSREYYSGPGRILFPQYLVQMKVLSEQARQQKLDQRPEVQKAIEVATESILADAARQQLEKSIPVPEDELQKLYESRKSEFQEVRLRRLLIRTDNSILSQTSVASRPPLSSAEARRKLAQLRQQILDGADFADIARTNSDDGASAPSGGDLGFVNFRTLIPPVMQAADSLAPGQVSDIIPTAFGMELIQVVAKRTKPLEEVRPQLEASYRQGKLAEKLQELQNQYKIDVDMKFFMAPKTAPKAFETITPPNP
jgi:parvulin-like peptidyl-prolyl isomerase